MNRFPPLFDAKALTFVSAFAVFGCTPQQESNHSDGLMGADHAHSIGVKPSTWQASDWLVPGERDRGRLLSRPQPMRHASDRRWHFHADATATEWIGDLATDGGQ